MTAVANVPDPIAQPSRSGRLLDLVRKLIEHGRELAATIRRRAFTEPDAVRCCFGTIDIAQILASISRGLHRANALEAKIVRNAARLDAPPSSAAFQRRSRTPRPAAAAPTADKVDPRLAHLPTPERIAAEVRRRPIGAVIADICRDLGIMPSHPLWRQLQIAIIGNGGNPARLAMAMTKRAVDAVAATWPPGMVLKWPAPGPPFQPACGTGPP
jgi:hypothetical protein